MSKELPEHQIDFGKFKGQSIDTRTRYSLEISAETESHFWVDYFFHDGKFWTAKIPRRAVEKYIGQRFTFSKLNPFITHAQVRIILNDDIELYELGTMEEAKESLRDFVYSIEVVGPKGTAWSISQAFGAFVSAHRLLSTEEVVFERVTLGGYEMIQSPPILLDKELLNDALEKILRRGSKAGMKEKYYLFNFWLGANNCTSEVFDILDSLLSKRYTPFQKIMSKIFWRFPFAPRLYLRFRGAIDHKVTAPTLNEEFSELASSTKLTERRDKIRSSQKR